MRAAILSLSIPLAVASGCTKADPGAQAAAPAAASAGSPAAPPSASPTATAPAATGPKLGPIPLAHATVDFAALFPGDQVSYEPAAPGEGTMPPSPPSIYVRRPGLAHGTNDDFVVIAGLARKRITRLEVFAPGLAGPNGIEVGATAAQAARALPGARCHWGGSWRGVLCSSPRAPAFTLQFDATEWGDDLASAPEDLTVAAIIWDAPKGARLTIKRRPPRAKTGAAANPTPDESDSTEEDAGEGEFFPLSPEDCATMVTKLATCAATDAPTHTWLATGALGQPRTPAAVDTEVAAWAADPARFCTTWDTTHAETLFDVEGLRDALPRDCGALRTALGDLLVRDPSMGTWLAPIATP